MGKGGLVRSSAARYTKEATRSHEVSVGAFTASTGTHSCGPSTQRHSTQDRLVARKRQGRFRTYDFERTVERARSSARRNPDVLSLQNGLDYCKEQQSGGHGRTAQARGPSPQRREGDAPHVTCAPRRRGSLRRRPGRCRRCAFATCEPQCACRRRRRARVHTQPTPLLRYIGS